MTIHFYLINIQIYKSVLFISTVPEGIHIKQTITLIIITMICI